MIQSNIEWLLEQPKSAERNREIRVLRTLEIPTYDKGVGDWVKGGKPNGKGS